MEETEISGLSREKKWSLSCYIPFFNIITCVLASVKVADNQSVRFHARQGLLLSFVWFFSFLIMIVSSNMGLLLLIVCSLFYVIEIIAILTDTFLILPGVGQIASKIPDFYLYRLLTGKEPSELGLLKNKNL